MRLQARFLLVIVPVITVAFLGLGYLVYLQLRQNSESELRQEMQTLLSRASQQSDAFVITTESNVDLFATSSLLESWFLEDDESVRRGSLLLPVKKLLTRYNRSFPAYREIRLMQPNGFEDVRVAEPILANRAESEAGTDWFDEVGLNWGLTVHSSVVEHPDDGQLNLIVTKSMKLATPAAGSSRPTPRLRGYIVVSATLDFLQQEIRRQRIGKTGYLMLVDADARVVLAPENRGIDVGGLAEALVRLDSGDVPDGLVGAGSAGQQGTTMKSVSALLGEQQSTIMGQTLLGDYRLVAVVPDSEFDEAGSVLATVVAAGTLLVIVLLSALFYALLSVFVLRPLTQLRRGANDIGDGLSVDIEIWRDDELGELASAFRDMNIKLADSMQELRRSQAHVEQMAYQDELTGLPNRRRFVELVQDSIAAAASERAMLAVLFLDLDGFKRLNDTEGHVAGDRLLQAVGERLRRCADISTHDEARPCDVARLGGDEFIMLLGGIATAKEGSDMAQMVLDALDRPFKFEGRDQYIGCSIGIAMYPEHAANVDDLIKGADMAMYEIKHQHKGTWRFFNDAMQSTIASRLVLEADLRHAFDSGDQLELYYQPQYATGNCTLSGLEVLLRWNHPERGMVPPDQFIGIAEDTGLIGPIGEWVLKEACQQWRSWQLMNLSPGRLAVNVSQRQFAIGDILSIVNEVLETHAIDADSLELEITESCMMEAPGDVIDTLHRLRQRGVHVAMDDFGTGYSSLSLITTLPIDTVKIDRCFIAGIQPDSPNEKIVAAVMLLAKSLDLQVIAEGVETADEMDYLRSIDCDVVQGFYLGRPQPSTSITELLYEAKSGLPKVAVRS